MRPRRFICPVAKSLTTRQSLIAPCVAAYLVVVCCSFLQITILFLFYIALPSLLCSTHDSHHNDTDIPNHTSEASIIRSLSRPEHLTFPLRRRVQFASSDSRVGAQIESEYGEPQQCTGAPGAFQFERERGG